MRRRKSNLIYLCSLLSIFLIALCTGCGGDASMELKTVSLNLQWRAPLTDSTGEVIQSSAITGYKIYIGSIPSFYTETIDVGNTTSYQIQNLDVSGSQNRYFAVTAYDASGRESDFSNEITIF